MLSRGRWLCPHRENAWKSDSQDGRRAQQWLSEFPRGGGLRLDGHQGLLIRLGLRIVLFQGGFLASRIRFTLGIHEPRQRFHRDIAQVEFLAHVLEDLGRVCFATSKNVERDQTEIGVRVSRNVAFIKKAHASEARGRIVAKVITHLGNDMHSRFGSRSRHDVQHFAVVEADFTRHITTID